MAEKPVYRSELGVWWDCLAGIGILQGLLNVFRSWSEISLRSDILVSGLILSIAVGAAILSGRYAGFESPLRKYSGFLLIGLGIAMGTALF